jgi:hypothetical protein
MFSREEEARALFQEALDTWKSRRSADATETHFPGRILQQSWPDFCDQVFAYRLADLAAPIKAVARAHGWKESGYDSGAKDAQFAS